MTATPRNREELVDFTQVTITPNGKVFKCTSGAAIRLVTLMTHYRKPMDFTNKAILEAERILGRWLKVAEPCQDEPPVEVLEALMDDLNTPKAIAAMHVYRGKGEGKKLFAAMRFLGLFDGTISLPDDWRTIPDDIQPGLMPGPDTLGIA